jgi:hypothetical protein
MSELKEFNLSKALEGCSVQTRDGRVVSNIKVVSEDVIYDDGVNSKYQQALVGDIHNTGGIHTHHFYSNGTAHKYLMETGADLFMV